MVVDKWYVGCEVGLVIVKECESLNGVEPGNESVNSLEGKSVVVAIEKTRKRERKWEGTALRRMGDGGLVPTRANKADQGTGKLMVCGDAL